MKNLIIDCHFGKNVTFICSDWDVWFDVTYNVKYLCLSPCTKDKDIIIRASFGKTERKNRIFLVNKGNDLSVTLIDLQTSHSKKYVCGVERFGPDSFIQVILRFIDGPKTTAKTVTAASTVPFAAMDSTIISSSPSDTITNMPASYTLMTTPNAPITPRAGSVLYLVIGFMIIITILTVVLTLMRKLMKKQLTSSADWPQEDTQGDVEYDEIRTEDRQAESPPLVLSTVRSSTDTDPDRLYANFSYHHNTDLAAARGKYSDVSLNSASKSRVGPRGACADSRVTAPQNDLVYSVMQPPKQQNDISGKSEPNQSGSHENDSIYFLAQLPQVT
ncbi:uncharacterized protein [Trachinotus anak]|uniref:uncharacterized protein n=1 Tax=Trachinotus anak TaxID=443729 RepID=UPI0039F242AB